MEMTFKRRKHWGMTIYESNETVTGRMGIEFPKYRIVKEKTEKGELFILRELNPEKSDTYEYNWMSGEIASKKLENIIEHLNIKLHRI